MESRRWKRASGRPSRQEFKSKQRKLAYTIKNTLDCPELLAVQEVEEEAFLLDLAALTHEACGFLYQVTHRESADGRGIDVALLSDPRRVVVGEVFLHQLCTPLSTGVHDRSVQCTAGEEPLFSRPPLEVGLRIDGEPLTIIVNHFKSKRGGDVETAPRRQAQARHVNDLVKSRLAGDPQAAIVVLGDFNDYNLSEVWQQLQAGDVLFDTMQMVSPGERYSYIFDGVSQLVDGILVSPALVHRVVDAAIIHVNADYPINYAFDDSPSGLPYRSSDHDPLMITIQTPPPSEIDSVATETLTRPEKTPTALMQPTERIAADVKVSPAVEVLPTIQPADPGQPGDRFGSTQYVVFAGLSVVLLAAVLFWLMRRGSK